MAIERTTGRAPRRPAALLVLLITVACSAPQGKAADPTPTQATVRTSDATPATTHVATTGVERADVLDAPVAATAPDSRDPGDRVAAVPGPDGPVVSAFAGRPWFLGRVPSVAVGADPVLEPIVLGMINQEDTSVGSYPELRVAVEAAVAWVNAELGGVDGHPVRLVTCITGFDADRSQACARRLVGEGVVALVGGVDVLGSYTELEAAGIAAFGGIPANLVQQQSLSAFFFSGGDAGALAAFMAHAADAEHTTVAVGYASEVPSFEVAARDYGGAVGRSLGLDVHLVPFSLFADDQAGFVDDVRRSGADAVMVLAATAACDSVVAAAAELSAQLYMTGACAGATTVATARAAGVRVVWNAEGPVDGVDVEAALYQAVVERYAEAPAGGAGTVGFRGFMNLYALLRDAGADVTSADLVELARGARRRPSFWGHPYTCDGRQVPGLPALCAPQQVLFTATEDGTFESLTGWVPTDRLFAEALGRTPVDHRPDARPDWALGP